MTEEEAYLSQKVQRRIKSVGPGGTVSCLAWQIAECGGKHGCAAAVPPGATRALSEKVHAYRTDRLKRLELEQRVVAHHVVGAGRHAGTHTWELQSCRGSGSCSLLSSCRGSGSCNGSGSCRGRAAATVPETEKDEQRQLQQSEMDPLFLLHAQVINREEKKRMEEYGGLHDFVSAANALTQRLAIRATHVPVSACPVSRADWQRGKCAGCGGPGSRA